ncbi:MAG: family 78 glycoside hydrolase catalytic domain [Christensenellales bacterium]
MKIQNLYTNHLECPLGYEMERPIFSWTVFETGALRQSAAQVIVAKDENFASPLFDSGRKEDISSVAFSPDIELEPYTRYWWKVLVWADNGDFAESDPAWFETAKMGEPWQAKWIGPPFEKEVHPWFVKRFSIEKQVESARVYATGLGVYELYMNGCKEGDEFLAPFFTGYDNFVQYQTYDVTMSLKQGENMVAFMLGNGWYKGRFGFQRGMKELYGDSFLLIAELHIKYSDGTTEVICTGDDWACEKSAVLSSSIYDGEEYDARLEVPFERLGEGGPAAVLADDADINLVARLSPPVRITETVKPIALLKTPAGEDVLDFGQVLTGWLEFDLDQPEGTEVFIQFGELLQQDNFYNENLRTAKQEYRYISAGQKAHVRPYFTFYGFRYAKIQGLKEIRLEDFSAQVIHSDLAVTGNIKTSNEKVNKLFQNAFWGQRGNFLDVPTDCPQRDERMGWTGDAQVFARTASYNMYTPAFFAKYMYDMLWAQKNLDGAVPHVIPDVLQIIYKKLGMDEKRFASCAWADAATIIPWTVYVQYGDKALLEQQYESMKLWTEYVYRIDENECGGSRLWTHGNHFADWLALDNHRPGSLGGTDQYYVASCYYYYSALLTSKAAAELGYDDDRERYQKLSQEVKAAIQKEYFTPTGRLAINTQTAYILALHFDIAPPQYKDRVIKDLKENLDSYGVHLTTGFVGTAYICETLVNCGLADYAYTLLLNEDYPSWLYAVNMGATTIWERWNSILPDGTISGTGMNSLNHYAYGAIAGWMYSHMCGLKPCESAPGFKRVVIEPHTDKRLEFAQMEYLSAAGLYGVKWEYIDDAKTKIRFVINVPFDASARFSFPCDEATLNGEVLPLSEGRAVIDLNCAEHVIECRLA